MIRRRVTFLLAVSFVVLLGIPTARGADEEFRITHEARSLQPGEVVLLSVSCSRPLSELTARALKREFPLFSEEDRSSWFGLIGIDLEAKPGDFRILLRGKELSGEVVETTYDITLLEKNFPTRNLTVEPKFVSPPKEELDRIAEERKLVSGIFATSSPERFWEGSFLRPVPGEAGSSFGKRSVFNGKPRSPHTGTDFRASEGTPVKAPNAGRVVLAKDLFFAGNTVIIDHGRGLFSYFAHLSAFKVKEGDQVQKGKVVGLVGATGRVTGPHLHWTVRLSQARVDPLSLMSVLEE
jgi:murein DD-endopeptidase MepM/ murein hydrolase activator NlpD